MQAAQVSELLAIVKGNHIGAEIADHMPVGVSNTMSEITDKSLLAHLQGDYVTFLVPQHLGVGIKFAA
jgi:hypothetical protein